MQSAESYFCIYLASIIIFCLYIYIYIYIYIYADLTSISILGPWMVDSPGMESKSKKIDDKSKKAEPM